MKKIILLMFVVVFSLILFVFNSGAGLVEVKSLEELARPRLIIHCINLPGDAIYIQLPDAGEILITGAHADGAKTIISYIENDFKKRKGRIASIVQQIISLRPRIDLLLNTSLDLSSLRNILDLYKKIEVKRLLSSLSTEVPSKLTDLPQELGQFAYLCTFYAPYETIKKGKNVLLPPQERVELTLSVLYPPKEVSYKEYLSNFRSKQWIEDNFPVLKLSFNKFSFLYIPSISTSFQDKLLMVDKEDLKSSLLRISGHPGVISPDLVKKVEPQILLDDYQFNPSIKSIVFTTDGEKFFLERR